VEVETATGAAFAPEYPCLNKVLKNLKKIFEWNIILFGDSFCPDGNLPVSVEGYIAH
jgi:hypothetical protein